MRLLVFCLLAVSCAYTGMELVPQKMQPLDDFAEVTMVGGNALIFDIGKITDLRLHKDRVGMAKTGLSNTATPIVIQGGVETYVQTRLRDGLKKRGVSVRSEEKNTLTAKILELRVGESSNKHAAENSVCRIKMALELNIAGAKNPKWSGEVAVEAASKGTIFDATGLNGPMLESCMNEFVEKLIRDEKFQQITGIRL